MKQLIRLSGIIEQKIDKGKDGGHDEDIHRVYDGPYYEFSQKRENILQQIQTIDDRERAQKAAEEAKVLQQTEGNADQIQVQQEQEDLDFIQEQTEQIVTDMQDLKEITQQVHDKIQSDHQVVVRIDEKIEEAKVDMVEGNKELEKAEQDQKKCNIY
ncbi:hypothetical protein GPJ56_002174 [Histomonas meleagridis]|nr:hypothetical protein GPJ56_002174 [Histomonas meleagridis]